jgi:hypothetical protein
MRSINKEKSNDQYYRYILLFLEIIVNTDVGFTPE